MSRGVGERGNTAESLPLFKRVESVQILGLPGRIRLLGGHRFVSPGGIVHYDSTNEGHLLGTLSPPFQTPVGDSGSYRLGALAERQKLRQKRHSRAGRAAKAAMYPMFLCFFFSIFSLLSSYHTRTHTHVPALNFTWLATAADLICSSEEKVGLTIVFFSRDIAASALMRQNP